MALSHSSRVPGRAAGGPASIGRMSGEFTPIPRTPYLKTLPDGSTRHATDLIGDAAVDFLERAAGDQPFCLSISFNAGHAEDGKCEDEDRCGLPHGLRYELRVLVLQQHLELPPTHRDHDAAANEPADRLVEEQEQLAMERLP